MSEHLILMFAYHYPPENAVGGARPFRFSKYLSRLGYTCRVFTAADQTGRDDPDTEYVPDPFVTHSRHRLGWQLERAVRKLLLPGDVGVRWSYCAARAARAYLRAHPGVPVTIFSTFPPLGSHFAGWQLAKSNKLPWIADCRDPIVEEFTDELHTPAQKRVYRWLESLVARRADAVIANTDAALVQWQRKFPRFSNKFQLIWNGFDPEQRLEPLPVLYRDCKILSHVGELYHGRNAASTLESIARLLAAKRISPRRVRVRLIGPAQSECLPGSEFIHRAQSEGWLELVAERIPQQQALQVARTSNGLLLIQSQSPDHVPAKVFDCLRIGRPILAYIQRNSPAERLLERSGIAYRCIYPDSTPEEVDDTIAEFFNLPSTAVAASPWFEEQFNAVNQTKQLDAIIRSLHYPDLEMILSPECLAASRSIIANQEIEVRGKTENTEIDLIDRA